MKEKQRNIQKEIRSEILQVNIENEIGKRTDAHMEMELKGKRICKQIDEFKLNVRLSFVCKTFAKAKLYEKCCVAHPGQVDVS